MDQNIQILWCIKKKLLTNLYKSSILLNRTPLHKEILMIQKAIVAIRRFFGGAEETEMPEARAERLAKQSSLGEEAFRKIYQAAMDNPTHSPDRCAIGIGTMGPLQVYTLPFNGKGDMYTVLVFISDVNGWTGVAQQNAHFVLQLDISVWKNTVSFQTTRNGEVTENALDQFESALRHACRHVRAHTIIKYNYPRE